MLTGCFIRQASLSGSLLSHLPTSLTGVRGATISLRGFQASRVMEIFDYLTDDVSPFSGLVDEISLYPFFNSKLVSALWDTLRGGYLTGSRVGTVAMTGVYRPTGG